MNNFSKGDKIPQTIFYKKVFFAIDLGIGAKNPHSVDEYISLHDMELVVRTALTIILE